MKKLFLVMLLVGSSCLAAEINFAEQKGNMVRVETVNNYGNCKSYRTYSYNGKLENWSDKHVVVKYGNTTYVYDADGKLIQSR